ncbi:LAMI_0B07800g1_1 [Lachancea mirantina]|uniref:LAMI_0B07800g1_1 n=1 Tax=Lachancea mirantina TaxID=1230905 RepID=A0A1G4IXL4_9SACH|nr:LAMI_0B07800g1_1 [Lachancea mirantina]
MLDKECEEVSKEEEEIKPTKNVVYKAITTETSPVEEEENNRKKTDTIAEIPEIRLPSDFRKCSRTDLVIVISRMLSFLIYLNDTAPDQESKELTRFHSRVPPVISVYNYLLRLTRYSSLEPAVLISAVYYIDLLAGVYPAFSLNSLTVHRFLLTATSVASKGLCDAFCTNTHYAKVGGVQCSELHILENEFLQRVNYRILPRDHNIEICKQEHQIDSFVTPHYRVQHGTNDGFNVLSTYYRKIIELVGLYDSSPDKTKKANYVLEHSKSSTIESVPRKRQLEEFAEQQHEPKQRDNHKKPI